MDLTFATGELGTQDASHKPTASTANVLPTIRSTAVVKVNLIAGVDQLVRVPFVDRFASLCVRRSVRNDYPVGWNANEQMLNIALFV